MLFGVVLELWDFLWIMIIVTFALSGLSVYLKPKDRQRMKRIETKLDQLLKHAGLTYDPFDAAPPGVVEAVKRGDINEAVKLYRKATGSTFSEAFEYAFDLKKLAENTKEIK
jgi:hypothetical protein